MRILSVQLTPFPLPPTDRQMQMYSFYCYSLKFYSNFQDFYLRVVAYCFLSGPVAQRVDSAIQRINLYPVDSAIGFPNAYPLDGDLSSG